MDESTFKSRLKMLSKYDICILKNKIGCEDINKILKMLNRRNNFGKCKICGDDLLSVHSQLVEYCGIGGKNCDFKNIVYYIENYIENYTAKVDDMSKVDDVKKSVDDSGPKLQTQDFITNVDDENFLNDLC